MMRSKPVPPPAAGLRFLLTALGAAAQETNPASSDKAAYSLFNPVPVAGMRELSPDRPDKTESPYTVDPGLEFAVTGNVQPGGGCNFGVTRAADNRNPFAGLTMRF